MDSHHDFGQLDPEIYQHDGVCDHCGEDLPENSDSYFCSTECEKQWWVEKTRDRYKSENTRLTEALKGCLRELKHWHSLYPDHNGAANIEAAESALVYAEEIIK